MCIRDSTALNGDLLGRELVAHQVQNFGGRTDKFDASFLASPGKITVLTQKAIAGVDSIGTMPLSDFNDAGNIQISAQGAEILTDQIGLIGSGTEDAVCILFGVNCNRLNVQIMAGPEHTHGDFAAVGHQDFFE